MRLISFALTTPQVRARTKTETRRDGWLFLIEAVAQPDPVHLLGVEKAMGRPRGEPLRVLWPIHVLAAWREPLEAIDQAACIREGFPDFTPADFVAMYRLHSAKKPFFPAVASEMVTVIQFRYPDIDELSRRDRAQWEFHQR